MRILAKITIIVTFAFLAWPYPAKAQDCNASETRRVDSTKPAESISMEFLQVRAVLTPDGLNLHRKHPLKWVYRTHPQTVPVSDKALCLRIRFSDGDQCQIPFDAYVEGDTVDGPKLFGGFTLEVHIPQSAQISELDITDKKGFVLVTWPSKEIPERN